MSDSPETRWELPDPVSVHEVKTHDGARLLLRRHGNPDGPRLVLSHGNALAIDMYYPFWSLLMDEFDLIVHDLRNHGWNEAGDLTNHNVPSLVADHDSVLEAIESEYGEKPQAGVFHSVSALVSLLSPARGARYDALILFDPPICKPGRGHKEYEEAAARAAGLARSRTNTFSRLEDFAELLALLPSFGRFVPGAHDLMASATLRESADKTGYELRCPREHEAQMIDYASVYAVSVDFGAITCPLKVVGADPTLPYSYLPTLDMSDVLSVDYDFLPESTHFLQMERPVECAAAVRNFLQKVASG